jgi:hypothetical protein
VDRPANIAPGCLRADVVGWIRKVMTVVPAICVNTELATSALMLFETLYAALFDDAGGGPSASAGGAAPRAAAADVAIRRLVASLAPDARRKSIQVQSPGVSVPGAH